MDAMFLLCLVLVTMTMIGGYAIAPLDADVVDRSVYDEEYIPEDIVPSVQPRGVPAMDYMHEGSYYDDHYPISFRDHYYPTSCHSDQYAVSCRRDLATPAMDSPTRTAAPSVFKTIVDPLKAAAAGAGEHLFVTQEASAEWDRHDHHFSVSQATMAELDGGHLVSVTTGEAHGHSHHMTLYKDGDRYLMGHCDCDLMCFDDHGRRVFLVTA